MKCIKACTNGDGCNKGADKKLSEGTSKSDSEHRECFLKKKIQAETG